MKTEGKTVLVTGSSSGIGRETVKRFAEEGSEVIVTYNSGEDRAKEVARYCKKYTDTKVFKLDVTDLGSIRKLVKDVEEHTDGLDMLINNAGVLVKGHILDLSHEDIRKQVEVNLLGLIDITRAFLPMFYRKREGMIINIASGLGKSGMGGYGVYSATKFGVRGFTQALADELPSGVKTYVVNPSMTSTNMTNYRGMEPDKAADIIVDVAKEKYGKRSGQDIDISKYI